MSLLCLVLGHVWSHGCRCDRCGRKRNEHHEWDGCKCTMCDEVNHHWFVKDWSYDGQKYAFEKECVKCGEKNQSIEHVPFGKMVLGKQLTIS